MPLESATYIDGLNSANPAGTDQVAQSDDHLRLIKSTLKATFPNLTGPVTATQDTLNQGLPAGIIAMWSGAVGDIPDGWGLCDGTTYTKVAGGSLVSPNLVNRFVYGGSASIGTTAGAATHSHTITIGSTTLTTDQIPSHSHGVTDAGHSHSVFDPGHTHLYQSGVFGTGAGGVEGQSAAPGERATVSAQTSIQVIAASTGISINNAGGGGSHTHSGSSASASNLPPYMVLAYIIKL